MKNKNNKSITIVVLLAVLVTLSLLLFGCPDGMADNYSVTFEGAAQIGGESTIATSTGLTLSFDVDPTSLAASDITVTGATKGELSDSGATRTLTISGITVGNGETVSVAIASPTGFTISGSPQTAVVYNEYAVGDLGPSGGHIFYDKGPVSDGWRYLEAAPSDLVLGESDYSHIFGYYRTTSGGTNELVGTDTGIGTGQANTTALVSAMGSEAYTGSTGTTTTANYAARLCDTYTVGIHGDWFLPSKDELNQMYLNLKNEGIGGFSGELYWSSSEYNANYAWYQYFYYGNQSNFNRYYNYRVRPVRAF